MVLPQRPAGTEDWSEKRRCAALVTRDSLIGTQRELDCRTDGAPGRRNDASD